MEAKTCATLVLNHGRELSPLPDFYFKEPEKWTPTGMQDAIEAQAIKNGIEQPGNHNISLIHKMSMPSLNMVLIAMPSLWKRFRIVYNAMQESYSFVCKGVNINKVIFTVKPFGNISITNYFDYFANHKQESGRRLLLHSLATISLLMAPDIMIKASMESTDSLAWANIVSALKITNKDLIAAIAKMNNELKAVVPKSMFCSREAVPSGQDGLLKLVEVLSPKATIFTFDAIQAEMEQL